MTMPYEHLVFAQRQLEHVRTQLNKALELTKSQKYGPDWIRAIERALTSNEETDQRVGNILVNIRSPQYEQLIEGFQKEE